uniref:Zinc finger protein 593 homolog n=1 Tax=Heterorhabditis bacteriophora TaxID=37862 RepID=A0A1I7XR56_HETBA
MKSSKPTLNCTFVDLSLAKFLVNIVDLDLPGDGQFYCIECERYFIDEQTKQNHKKTKLHKNRVKTLREIPYSHKEAEAAGGLGISTLIMPALRRLSGISHLFIQRKWNSSSISELRKIYAAARKVYGFDYDYTLAVYTRELSELIYELALSRLVTQFKVITCITTSVLNNMMELYRNVCDSNIGMTYMLGTDWKKYFKYIVVSAKKPTFFYGHEPFRVYDDLTDAVRFEKVMNLEKGKIYAGVSLFLNGRTGKLSIITYLLRKNIRWLEILTLLIEKFQINAAYDSETENIVEEWRKERAELREQVKIMFNPQFGSLFRTYNNMTFFSRRLNRILFNTLHHIFYQSFDINVPDYRIFTLVVYQICSNIMWTTVSFLGETPYLMKTFSQLTLSQKT